MKKKSALKVLVGFAMIPAALAADKPCDPVQPGAPDPAGPEVKKVIQTLESKDSQAHAIDATFKFTAIKQDGMVRATSVAPELSLGAYAKVYDLWNVTSGRPAGYTSMSAISISPAGSFDQAMSILKQQGKSMSTDERLLYLSMLGSSLSQGYDNAHLKNQSLEATFQNLAANGTNGGICGSIHEYLSRAAAALGFQSAGLNSSIWQKSNDKGKTAEGHYVSFFKDPSTGKYYSQNYSQLIDTGMTTLQGAVDVANQTLTPLVGASYIESKPGTFHAYVPNTARWVEQQLSKVTGAQPAPMISVQASNVESQVALRLQKNLSDHARMNGFVIHSEYKADEGKFGLDAVGISVADVNHSGPALHGIMGIMGMIDEVNVSSRIYGGFLQMSAPDPVSSVSPASNDQKIRSNAFFGVEQKRSARIDQVTGSIALDAKTIDFKNFKNGMATLQIRPGIEWASTKEPVKVGIERTIDVVPTDSTQYVHPTLRTAYDKISVIYDTSGKESQAYLVAQGNVYAMEGITKNTATGLRAQLEAVIPVQNRGEFIVVADASKITSNKSKDPFYDTPLSTRLGVTWRKAITKAIEVGASVEVSKNRMNSVFADEKDVVTPGSTSVEKGTRKVGMFWLRSQW
ncbi:MAG: hypothetical protein ACJ763_15290 [Bdellovibrionia bacterium]